MTADLVPVPAIPCYAKKPYEGYYRIKSIMEKMLGSWLDAYVIQGPWFCDPEEPVITAPSGRYYYYM